MPLPPLPSYEVTVYADGVYEVSVPKLGQERITSLDRMVDVDGDRIPDLFILGGPPERTEQESQQVKAFCCSVIMTNPKHRKAAKNYLRLIENEGRSDPLCQTRKIAVDKAAGSRFGFRGARLFAGAVAHEMGVSKALDDFIQTPENWNESGNRYVNAQGAMLSVVLVMDHPNEALEVYYYDGSEDSLATFLTIRDSVIVKKWFSQAFQIFDSEGDEPLKPQ